MTFIHHLALDFCSGGIIEELSHLLRLPTKSTMLSYQGYTIVGGVRIVENYPLTFDQLLERLAVLGTRHVRIAGERKKIFSKIALTSGKGFMSEFFDQLKPEVYIAGEFEQEATKYAEDLGILLVELSHHGSEVAPLKKISKKLSKVFAVPVCDIEIDDTIETVFLND